MSNSLNVSLGALVCAAFASLFFILLPLVAQAQANLAQPEDLRCAQDCARYAADDIQGNECTAVLYPCGTSVAGSQRGICQIDGCKALNYSGAQGSGGVGLEQVQKILGGLFDKLMQQAQQGGQQGGGGSTPQTTGTQTSGCTQYYQVSEPSTDPCAYYVPPISSQLGSEFSSTNSNISDLLNQLGAGSTDTQTNTNTNTTPVQSILSQIQTSATVSQTSTSSSTTTRATVPNPFSLIPGIRGDIQFLNDGATIIAGTRSEQSQTEVAGFYGSATVGGEQPTGLVAGLCQSRPWASNFLSSIVAPSFFDSLCSWRGYQVGTPVQSAPQVSVTQSTPRPTTEAVAPTSTAPFVEPKVDVWAVPASVPLGARTSVFWNTQGVTSCTVTSPDGSFSQSTLSGGASTVPLVTATTFTISCLTPDGTPVTDYVTVQMAI